MTDTTLLNDALAANYMLVDLDIRSWSGRVTDRTVSSEVIASKGAARDSGKFVKYLFASADAELTAVQKAAEQVRQYARTNSVPWCGRGDGATNHGPRLIAAVNGISFLAGLNEVKKPHDEAVQTLVSVWDARVQQAIANLGGLASIDDYPRADQVAAMFGVRVDLLPVPAQSDFTRLNVPTALIEALGQRHAKALEGQMGNAMADLKERLLTCVGRMSTQMTKKAEGSERTRLYDSLNTNLQTMVGLVRSMNATGKPELTALCDRIERELLAVPIAAVRTSPAKAAEVAQAAQAIATDAAIAAVWEL
jgi:hypothetical protein